MNPVRASCPGGCYSPSFPELKRIRDRDDPAQASAYFGAEADGDRVANEADWFMTKRIATPAWGTPVSRRHFWTALTKSLALGGLISSSRAFGASWGVCEHADVCPSATTSNLAALRYFDTAGHSSVVTDQLHAGMPFETTAIFDDKIKEYVLYEFRQYVRGYICYKRPGSPSWKCIALHLSGDNILDPSTFQEDGYRGAAYGHRISAGCSDNFGPDPHFTRKDGWLYTASDFPGIKDFQGTEYQIKLNFRLQIVNIQNSCSPDPKALSISCSGVLPQVHVAALPEQPPVIPYWLNSPDDHSTRTVVTKPRTLEGLQYSVRLILAIQRPGAVIYVCFVKPNDAPPIVSFELALSGSAGQPFRVINQVIGDALPEGQSGGTTAQMSVELSESDLDQLKQFEVRLGADKVIFSAEDLQLQ